MTERTAPTDAAGLFVGTPDTTQGTDRPALVLNPARTGPFRPVDWSVVPQDTFFSLHLHLSEDIIIYLSGNAPGLLGPPPHAHSVDQHFFQLEGEIELVLGSRTHRLRAGDWAHIPAGTPHKHRNVSPTERELHLEVMAPGFDMTVPFMLWESAASSAWSGEGTVVAKPPLDAWERMVGDTRRHVLSEPSGRLATPAPDSRGLTAWLARTPAGGALHSQMHVHAFTQAYYVTEGQLAVEVGLETHVAQPHTLVLIPRGVPHRNWVVGDAPEAHVHINVPAPPHPDDGGPWDVPVVFAPLSA